MPDSPRQRQKVGGALPMVETRNKYAQLMRQGISNAEACRQLNINRRTGMRWRHGRTVTGAYGRATTYAPISLKAPPSISPRYLSENERIQIADALQAGKILRQIAVGLGRSPSTVSREVIRNRSPRMKRYAPRAAQVLADAARKRPRLGKIAGNPQLRDAISKHLLEQWSPRQISHQLRIDFPGQPEMHVVHESIYQALYSPSATGLARGLSRHLRTGRRGRLTHRHTTRRRSRFSGPLLGERPAEVHSRLVSRPLGGRPRLRNIQPFSHCDPRGTCRQYFPKGTNLNLHSPERLAEVAAKINARPRESRNWEPAQVHFDRLKKQPPI